MIGKTLAHYEITGLLGKGGMGEVYRARDTKLGRDVALKILPSEFVADADRVARFRREAGLVAKLNDPGIVTIHSIDEADGHLFFTMEVVEGRGLDALLGSTQLSVDRFLKIASRIAAALAAAHEAGLVHRDLKPQNILITDDDRPKILDFGLAKGTARVERSREADATEVLTGDRQLVGTVPYMSPEQIESRPVDARSDLFSLGIIFHEMLSGSRPFRADSDAALLSAILRDEAPELSGIRSDVPQELASLIRECLQKNPKHRPSTAEELKRRLRALRTYSSGSDVKAAPEAKPSRGRLQWTLTFVFAAAILAAMYFGMRGGDETAEEAIDSIAVLPFEATGDAETDYVSDGLTERLINQLSRFDELKVMARSTVFRVDSSDPIEAGVALDVDAVVTGRVRSRGDRLSVGVELIRVADGTQMWGENFERTQSELIGLEQDLARGISGQLRVELSNALDNALSTRPTENNDAWRSYLRGRQLWHQRNPEALQRAGLELREAVTLDPNFALAHAALAQLHRVAWQYYDVDMDSENRLARLHAERALQLEPDLSEAHTAMALQHFEVDWDWAAAERSYRRAVELDPNNMTARQWYGEFLAARGRFEESFASFEEGMRIDPLSPVLHIAYAWSLMAGNRQDEAHRLVDELLEAEPDSWIGLTYRAAIILSGPKSHPRTRDALLAVLEFANADAWSEAEIERTRELHELHGVPGLSLAIAEVEEMRGPGSPVAIWMYALAYARMGDAEKLLPLIEGAFEAKLPFVVWLGTDPALRPFQSIPRFRALLEQHGIVTDLPDIRG